MDATLLRSLVDLRNRVLQKIRIAFGNRISAVERGVDKCDQGTEILFRKYYDRFGEMEQEVNLDIASLIHEEIIVQDVMQIKGIGFIFAALLVSTIDISKANTVSALWRYCGYAVFNGEREKPTKGEKLHYNKDLKSTCHLIGTSFLKCNSPYRQFYDQAKELYEKTHPEWPKLHRHNAAMRKMVKIFLAHLWEHWRELEGLPIRPVYILEHGHENNISRFDYGWPKRK